jgi:hypothetical protein
MAMSPAATWILREEEEEEEEEEGTLTQAALG